MQKLHEIQINSSNLKSYKVQKKNTVLNILKELNLESKYFVIIVDGMRAELNSVIEQNSEIIILPKIAGGVKGAKSGGKKGSFYVIKGDKVIRTRETCPKCGPGNFLADHYDRMHCGKCSYTKFKRK